MKTCTITGNEFEITEFETEFLKKIAPTFDGKKFELPFPTICPEERTRLRVMHRNEQYLYKNKSVFSQKPLVSIYPINPNLKVVSREEWFSDSWDVMEYGVDFDSSKPFFEQYFELQKKVPRAATVAFENENSEYTTGTGYCKNCYLINSSENCEDCYYSKLLQKCTNVIDCSYAYDSELLYQCFNVKNCYDCKWVFNAQNCNDCWFSDDMRACKNCFLCTNLVGKEYYFMNQPLKREEYESRIKDFFSDPKNFQKSLELFADLRSKRWCKYSNILNCEDCTGDFLTNSKNCTDCYDVNDSEDCKYVQVGIEVKDMYDCSNMYIKPELSYQTLGTIGTFNCNLCLYVFHSSDLWYCEQCFSCKNCFGCIGLRNKEYCIFNKQFKKETYEKKVSEIITHMEKTGEWGSFFPSWMSPFPHNKSVAHAYHPIVLEESEKRGYRWEKEENSNFLPQDYEIPERIEDVPDDICSKILSCSVTGKNYRIQPNELVFYKQMKLPVPNKCPDVRYSERMENRNARKLHRRKCSVSGKEVLSTYAPDRPEKILCEEEYLKIVS